MRSARCSRKRVRSPIPAATGLADTTPAGLFTPESYLGSARLQRYVGSQIHPNVSANYTFATVLPQDDLTYAGTWNVGDERIVAGMGAALRLHYHAQNVYVVLGGRGTVHALVNGKPTKRST